MMMSLLSTAHPIGFTRFTGQPSLHSRQGAEAAVDVSLDAGKNDTAPAETPMIPKKTPFFKSKSFGIVGAGTLGTVLAGLIPTEGGVAMRMVATAVASTVGIIGTTMAMGRFKKTQAPAVTEQGESKIPATPETEDASKATV
jgi:hypothetical protein